MKRFLEKYYGIVPLFLLCLFFAWKAVDFPIHDFTNYYFGGYFLANNTFDYQIYFPHHFNKTIADLGYEHLFGSFAPNTPFLALVFLPFSMLSLASAKLVFNGISIVLFLLSIWRLTSFYKIKPMHVALLAVVFFIPIKNNLLFGQVYFLLFFLLGESWLSYKKGQFKMMAFLLGFAILLKIFPALLMLIFLFKKEFKTLLYTAISCVILLLISVYFSGLEVWIYCIKVVLPKASNGEIATAFVDNYQSVLMFFKRWFVFDAVENPEAMPAISSLFPAVMVGFKIVILAIGFYITQKVSRALWVFSYWIIAMILLSPYGSTYTFILLIFPYLALSKSKLPHKEKVFFAFLLLLINNLPLSWFKLSSFPFSYIRLIFLSLFFLSFVSIVYKKINWKIVGLAFVIPFALLLIPFQESFITPHYLLEKDSPILVYDYKIEANQLTYFYWNEKGENHKTIPLECAKIRQTEIIENQVHYDGKLITNDKSNKLKPVIIDDKIVIYLSDFERGIGFYTLRKIDLH